jgi:phage-related protein
MKTTDHLPIHCASGIEELRKRDAREMRRKLFVGLLASAAAIIVALLLKGA